MGITPSTPLETSLADALSSRADYSLPSDPFYQLSAVKSYNTAFDITPAAVTRPRTAVEVAAIVKCAADNGLKVQARSGGHSYANFCLGGQSGAIIVDLTYFQQFSMDHTTWRATIGAGTLLADVTQRLHDNGGRAMAHGTCPQVGIGGHATIGGLGPISRLWGAALDHILEVEVVLANGTITRASETRNPDIFWALKGAAASFGIITEFVVRTQPEPAVMTQYSYNIQFGKHADLAPTFAIWQNLISDPNLTRKLASQVIVFEFGMVITGTYFGPKSEYDALGFEAKLAKNAVVTTTVFDSWLGSVANWGETEALKLVGGISGSFYSKSLAFTQNDIIPQSGIDKLFTHFDSDDKGTLIWFAIFDLEGGAINDVPMDATAYAHRDAVFYMQSYAIGLTGLNDQIYKYTDTISSIIQESLPGHNLGAYAGYVDPRLKNAQAQYWGSNLPRLEQIKKAVDPTDIFHNPQSVQLLGFGSDSERSALVDIERSQSRFGTWRAAMRLLGI